MGWIKTKLNPKWHDKVTAYRDESEAENMTEATAALLKRGVLAYESENGVLEDE